MKKKCSKYIFIYKNIFLKIEKLIPEELIGKKTVLQRRYKGIYGNESIEDRIISYRRNNLKRLLILLLGLVLVLAIFLITQLSEDNYVLKNEKGEIIAIRPPKGREITIAMEIGVFLEGEEKKELVYFSSSKVKDNSLAENEEETIEKNDEIADEKYKMAQREARLYINNVVESQPKDIYYLPVESEDGEKIFWYLKKTNKELLFVLLFPLLFIFIYRSRYRELNYEEARTKKVVQIELSEFITKLILLLDAGLVMSAAFQKIVGDYEWSVKVEGLSTNYFYQQLIQINHTILATKGNFTYEFKEFAYRTRIPEFIRIANIITDNYQIGSELVEKLRMEGEMLWFTRKKLAIEQGKLAEIKLSIPLMLLILSLLIITISPVLLEI